MKLRVLTLLTFILHINPANSGMTNNIIFSNSLESLCVHCSTEAANNNHSYQKNFSTKFENTNSTKDFVIVVQNNGRMNYYENYVLRNNIRSLELTDIGSNLISNMTDEHKLKIFYHLSSDLSINNKPLWVQEKSNPHDLFGFFAANNSSSVISLNLYQHPEVAVTTYLHELFHLYDPYIHKISKKGNPSEVEKFIGEYRAYLVEMNYYLQKQAANAQMLLRPVENYKFHEQFISRGKVNYNKLYNYLLDTHYPTDVSRNWFVDRGTPIEILIEKNNVVVGREVINIESNSLNPVMHKVLSRYLDQDKTAAFRVISKVRYKKISTKKIKEKNIQVQRKIKSTIGKDIKKYLKNHGLLDIRTLTTAPIQGTSFGPKERGKGD